MLDAKLLVKKLERAAIVARSRARQGVPGLEIDRLYRRYVGLLVVRAKLVRTMSQGSVADLEIVLTEATQALKEES